MDFTELLKINAWNCTMFSYNKSSLNLLTTLYFFIRRAFMRNLSFFVRISMITIALSIILLLVLAGLMYSVHLSQNQISFGVFFIYIISCFFGGFLTGKKLKVRRFLWGLCFGIGYFLILFIFSIMLGSNITENLSHILSVLLACAVSGMVGGIIG